MMYDAGYATSDSLVTCDRRMPSLGPSRPPRPPDWCAQDAIVLIHLSGNNSRFREHFTFQRTFQGTFQRTFHVSGNIRHALFLPSGCHPLQHRSGIGLICIASGLTRIVICIAGGLICIASGLIRIVICIASGLICTSSGLIRIVNGLICTAWWIEMYCHK
jgi:hypothetical protein